MEGASAGTVYPKLEHLNCFLEVFPSEVGINLCCLDGGVAKKGLDYLEISCLLVDSGGKGVS